VNLDGNITGGLDKYSASIFTELVKSQYNGNIIAINETTTIITLTGLPAKLPIILSTVGTLCFFLFIFYASNFVLNFKNPTVTTVITTTKPIASAAEYPASKNLRPCLYM